MRQITHAGIVSLFVPDDLCTLRLTEWRIMKTPIVPNFALDLSTDMCLTLSPDFTLRKICQGVSNATAETLPVFNR